jgi:ribosome recycling factor
MMDEINMYMEMSASSMEAALTHLHSELVKVRTGKASPAMLGGIMVEYYGAPTPLHQVANIATADARTLTIQPWERKTIATIERALFEANLGITPQNDGEIIRLSIPPLTEERRREFVKKAKACGEDAKVVVRNARRDVMEEIKKAVKNGFPEDAGKGKEAEAQKLTDAHITKIEHIVDAKEREIMTI